MAFTSVKPSENIKPGDYEVYVAKCGYTTTKNGRNIIEFDFVIREDVEQQYKGKHVTKAFFKGDDGDWPYDKIGKYANALGIEEGQEFDLPELIGLCCVLVIGEYNEKQCIRFTRRSKVKPYLTDLSSPAMAELADDDDDADLPF